MLMHVFLAEDAHFVKERHHQAIESMAERSCVRAG